MKCEYVTVRHPPLKPGDEEAFDAFERLLADAIKEWESRNNRSTEEVSRQLCETLLDRLQERAASLITPEAIAKIHDGSSAAEGKKLVKDIRAQISNSVKLDLIGLSGLPRRGRRREFATRDRQIWEMRRSGLSYGRIALKVGIHRNAVQAAYRREIKRRDSVRQTYANLRKCLGAIGIILEEA